MIDHMQGTLNAIGILAVVLGTGVLLRRGEKQRPDFAIVAYGLIFGVLSSFIGIACTSILWVQGNPLTQLIFPSACLMLVYIFLRSNRVVVFTMIALFVISLALGFHYLLLVGGGNYNGWPARVNASLSARRSNVISLIKTSLPEHPELAEKSYPAGPLPKSAIMNLVSPDDQALVIAEATRKHYTTHRLWHTWFTGLYGKTGTPIVLWYPGGKLQDGIERMEWKMMPVKER